MRPVLALTLALVACGGKSAEKPAETPAEKPAEKPAEAPAEKPVEQPATGVVASPVALSALPGGLGLLGEPVSATGWTDSDGENLLVLTAVAEHPMSSRDPDLRGAELYGYQLTRKGDAWTELWKIQDFVKDCPNDITARHLTDSVTVTDLDGDGQAETAWVYRIACRGDVSPATQKILMHEGPIKYALRGEARIQAGSEVYGGTFTADPAFSGAPPAFLDAAKGLWKKYELETF